MNREEQVKWGQMCQRRKMDMSQGLLCSLTEAKADFEQRCADYIPDEGELEFQKEQATRYDNDAARFSWKPVLLSLVASYFVVILIITFLILFGLASLLLYYDGV